MVQRKSDFVPSKGVSMVRYVIYYAREVIKKIIKTIIFLYFIFVLFIGQTNLGE